MRLPRGRRAAVAGGCALVLLAGTAVVVDTLVGDRIEERVTAAADCRLDARRVTVDLGRAAGLRALTGDLGEVRVRAEGVRRGGTPVDVDATLRGVTSDGRTSGGTGRATVGYAALADRLPPEARGMRLGGDGERLTLTGTTGALGLPVTVTAAVSTAPHAVTVTPEQVTVLGRTLSVSAVSALRDLPGVGDLAARLAPHTTDLTDLPAGVEMAGAHAGANGLTLDLRLTPELGGPAHTGPGGKDEDAADPGSDCRRTA
ncbi:hypothetical protein ACN20G_30835 (plasmid) [Streptomyces sp. BI20]|uniref:hypothetical protein n=1 Tax=Streptomyces sp. BI20 TaxID=3403460 RepID=UPI003C7211AA